MADEQNHSKPRHKRYTTARSVCLSVCVCVRDVCWSDDLSLPVTSNREPSALESNSHCAALCYTQNALRSAPAHHVHYLQHLYHVLLFRMRIVRCLIASRGAFRGVCGGWSN